ncbi:PREDICTED: non-specific lipid-transfer protein 1-like [Ipomoea nil]|uniref:non-specific lipid-transfer protein 1-like n=1 Tax=Ipomoea nil TaxID=35883 RepID=UPI000900BD4C|nr:PREDICTED: non-specific lipid-transfer protein 1-like [Ipomoea nil]
MAKAAWMVVVAVAAMMVGLNAQSMSCGTVVTDLYPCLDYVRNGGAVPMNCCDGIRSLYRSAATTADRQTVCNCMKNAAGSVPGVRLDLAAALPQKCGVTLPYKITPSINCATVQ